MWPAFGKDRIELAREPTSQFVRVDTAHLKAVAAIKPNSVVVFNQINLVSGRLHASKQLDKLGAMGTT